MEKRLWDVHVLVHFQEDCEVNKTDKAVEKVSAREFFYSLFFCFKLETLDHFKMLGRSIRDAFKSVFRKFSLSMAAILCATITVLVVSISLVIASVAMFFVIRTAGATVDSMIFYDYPFGAALAYNLSYIGPTCGVVAVLLILLLPVIKNLNRLYPTVYLKDIACEENSDDDNK